MSSIDDLISHWHSLDFNSASLVHPSDQAVMARFPAFDTSFVPYPYIGDLRTADIWVLMLNSNIGAGDAEQEAEPYFARRLRTNLEQRLDEYECPMLSMDPMLGDTGTYEYYNRRNGIAKLVSGLARRSKTTEWEARKHLARRLAVVQLLPYRSTSGVPQPLLGDVLASVRLVRAAVHEAVASKLVVVPRSAKNWGFEYGTREDNLFTFRADQARSASLSPGAPAAAGTRFWIGWSEGEAFLPPQRIRLTSRAASIAADCQLRSVIKWGPRSPKPLVCGGQPRRTATGPMSCPRPLLR